MFVARRAFRNCNQMILPGSVVEPGNIKWFKTRLKDRIIVEVAAHNFEQWYKYFKEKFGVLLEQEPKQEPAKDAEQEIVDVPKQEPEKDTEQETEQTQKVITVQI